MDQSLFVRLAERVTRVPQELKRPLGGNGPETIHEIFQVEAVEQLHHVVERPVVGHAEVVELDRVRRTHPGGRLRFAPESLAKLRLPVEVVKAMDIGAHQLDRRGPTSR